MGLLLACIIIWPKRMFFLLGALILFVIVLYYLSIAGIITFVIFNVPPQ